MITLLKSPVHRTKIKSTSTIINLESSISNSRHRSGSIELNIRKSRHRSLVIPVKQQGRGAPLPGRQQHSSEGHAASGLRTQIAAAGQGPRPRPPRRPAVRLPRRPATGGGPGGGRPPAAGPRKAGHRPLLVSQPCFLLVRPSPYSRRDDEPDDLPWQWPASRGARLGRPRGGGTGRFGRALGSKRGCAV